MMEKIKRAIEESKKNLLNKRLKNADAQVTDIQDYINEDEKNITYEFTRVIPLNSNHLAKNRIVSYNKNDRLSMSFDILRTQIINKMMENKWRTIAITSPIQGCGKTNLAINLAMSIAHHTSRTALLVDFDLRRPSVARYLGLHTKPSINDYFSGDATIPDIMINPGLERLVLLPTEMPVKNSSELLSSQKVVNMIQDIRDRYNERIVIFDVPPVLGSDDTMILMSQVDCVLIVVGDGMVSESELTECIRHIDNNKIIGTVLNKVEWPQLQQDYSNN